MLRFIFRRIIGLVPTMAGVSLIVFLILHLTPGDPARLIGGPDATEDDIVAIRHSMLLDRSLPEQYLTFVTRTLTGDLGESFRTRRPVTAEILDRLPYTIELATVAMAIALIVGVVAGTFSATRQYSVTDNLVTVGALVGVSIPSFWFGLVLLLIFSLTLGWFPASGRGGPLWTLEGLQYIALPAFTLGIAAAASVARLTRSSMLDVLQQDYMTTAKAKGLSAVMLLRRHALKNALIPVVTIAAIQFGQLLGGAIIVEGVFGWPGVGRLTMTSIGNRDYPMVQGAVLVLGLTFALLNLFVDVLYAYLDPRIRYK